MIGRRKRYRIDNFIRKSDFIDKQEIQMTSCISYFLINYPNNPFFKRFKIDFERNYRENICHKRFQNKYRFGILQYPYNPRYPEMIDEQRRRGTFMYFPIVDGLETDILVEEGFF